MNVPSYATSYGNVMIGCDMCVGGELIRRYVRVCVFTQAKFCLISTENTE